ncbi:MAG: Arc family DNA-binding protein [Lentisphaerae bacterium]|nr:Arc family DNA-binding protein [Lentisphaerota bacterium]
MAALIIRDVSPALHQRLKQEAVKHHRSMNREIITILEKVVGESRPGELPPPVKGLKPVDPQWIVDIIREAREGRP